MRKMKIELDSLYIFFSKIDDYRDNRGKKHKLIDIFILAFIGILSGYKNLYEMAYYLKKDERYFIKLLDWKYGIPSHDTFSRIFRKINVSDFMDCFIGILSNIYTEKGKHIALDEQSE